MAGWTFMKCPDTSNRAWHQAFVWTTVIFLVKSRLDNTRYRDPWAQKDRSAIIFFNLLIDVFCVTAGAVKTIISTENAMNIELITSAQTLITFIVNYFKNVTRSVLNKSPDLMRELRLGSSCSFIPIESEWGRMTSVSLFKKWGLTKEAISKWTKVSDGSSDRNSSSSFNLQWIKV